MTYAEAGIAEFWIVNLDEKCLEVYRQPVVDSVYTDLDILRSGEHVEIVSLPGSTLAVDGIL
jgi:Uma2 family endonuclease